MKHIISDSDLKKLVKIGQILRDKREEMGYSYKKVSDITRISSQYIKNIESGDYKIFPSLVFVKGFLRNYSTLLNIDPAPLLEEYNNIFNKEEVDSSPALVLSLNEEQSNSKLSSSNLVLFISGLIFILLISGGIFYVVYYNFYSVQKVNGKVTLHVSGNEIGADGEDNAVTGDPESASDAVFSLNLKLVSKNTGWIRLSIDNENEFDIYIDKLRTYRWSAVESFKLTLSKGSIAEVYFNDQIYPIDEKDANRLMVMNF